MPVTGTDPTYQHAVSAWAAHLLAGGTTSWADWRRRATDARADVAVLEPLPDATHLELVRRVNLEAGPGADLAGLADRILATPAPGRGLLDVPLPWTGAPRRFGTPPIDPALLPGEELVRLAVGVLAHLLPGVRPPAPDEPQRPWPAPWRRRFRLHGAPATVAAVRRHLLAQGYVETDWRPTHVVIGRPVEVMMAEHWGRVVRAGGVVKWSRLWRRAEASGRLPPQIDVAATAARLRDRRREPLHVVVARDAGDAAALAAGVLGARPPGVHGGPDVALSDLVRRLNRLAVLTQGPDQVRVLARTLVSVLGADLLSPGAPEPAPPQASLPWAREVAAAGAAALRQAGYAVHGDPGALAPTEHRLPGTVDRERTLALAVRACIRIHELERKS